MRSGQVRVLIGSTAKMGAGTNVQDKLIASHDLDCPWRPRDLTQRKGRIERQGNTNSKVHVCRYVTEGTFDAYLWQTVENKQKFISQVMTSKSPVRTCDDMDETALFQANQDWEFDSIQLYPFFQSLARIIPISSSSFTSRMSARERPIRFSSRMRIPSNCSSRYSKKGSRILSSVSLI